ncbi:TolB family protein [Corallococcus terminator]|uniref:TolB family protein n=1 Tax=Corallococcus terminator TaxID=2316733 RepID=UPI00131553A2|nr:PD40 domain-containing protein [Corallococcus terminator]
MALEVATGKPERIRVPSSSGARTLALSPDGQHVVFTTYEEGALNDLMYRWDWRTKAAPVRIGNERGFHADPAISPDGQWVYFAHHPRKGGPPGQHEERANAQLYRVRMDGTQLTALTDEPGCHLRPSFRPDGELVYVHTTCSATTKTLHLMREGQPASGPLVSGNLNEPSFAPDGRRLVFVEREDADAVLKEWITAGRPPKTLHRFRLSDSSNARVQYGATARELYFQDDDAVMRLVGPKVTRLFFFASVP